MRPTVKNFPETLNDVPKEVYASLYKLGYSMVGDLGPDAVHSALIRYSQNPVPVKGATLLTLLTRMVKWECLNILKKQGIETERTINLDDIRSTPDEFLQVIHSDQHIDVWKAINRLDPRYKTILTGLYYEGLSWNELSIKLNLSTSQVSNLYKEAKHLLQIYLQDYNT